MKLNLKLKLPKIDWQKYLRPALGLLVLAAFIYTGYLIRSSQNVGPDQKYLKQQQDSSSLTGLKVNQQLLDALGSPKPTVPAGRDPFSP